MNGVQCSSAMHCSQASEIVYTAIHWRLRDSQGEPHMNTHGSKKTITGLLKLLVAGAAVTAGRWTSLGVMDRGISPTGRCRLDWPWGFTNGSFLESCHKR